MTRQHLRAQEVETCRPQGTLRGLLKLAAKNARIKTYPEHLPGADMVSKRAAKRTGKEKVPPVTVGSRPVSTPQHGFSKEPLYSIWRTMLARCYQPGHNRYHRYGGRGITVCEQWWEYPAFRSWMNKKGWRKDLQLDRIDNDGSYDPSNCRLTTSQGNNRNRANNKVITYQGLTQSLASWADDRRCNVPYKVLWERLQDGMDFEKALLAPQRRAGGYRMLEAYGETKSVSEWALDARCPVSASTLWARVNRGWTHERAISMAHRQQGG